MPSLTSAFIPTTKRSRERPTASITISWRGGQPTTYAVGAFLAAVAGRDAP